jgi:hypothetical protein
MHREDQFIPELIVRDWNACQKQRARSQPSFFVQMPLTGQCFIAD